MYFEREIFCTGAELMKLKYDHDHKIDYNALITLKTSIRTLYS